MVTLFATGQAGIVSWGLVGAGGGTVVVPGSTGVMDGPWIDDNIAVVVPGSYGVVETTCEVEGLDEKMLPGS